MRTGKLTNACTELASDINALLKSSMKCHVLSVADPAGVIRVSITTTLRRLDALSAVSQAAVLSRSKLPHRRGLTTVQHLPSAAERCYIQIPRTSPALKRLTFIALRLATRR